MSLLATLIVGLLAGYLASRIMKTGGDLVTNLVIGILGSLIGGALTQQVLGHNLMSGLNLTSIGVAALGAVMLLTVLKLLRR